ncbi:MAG: nucleotide pyrophosphohydrolase [Candidatus Thermoplasmatota archaeon]|jgi:NTP pyrophosphatase (non-canonical NTP hydrolase)|nr:nucleotide pyrophosphohydrolase [Candidatus Thermoplasmatota archaeon]
MSADADTTLNALKALIDPFIKERDWERFHRPKDVAMALSIEAAELQELYLWDRKPDREALGDEMADVLFFLLDLSIREGVDLTTVFNGKMEKNKKRYPAALVKGKDLKYDKYER